jgi:N-acetylglucosamine kinase-like BadF-type ATPase
VQANGDAFLGVDTGGSHTEVAIAAPDGTILARAQGPGAAVRPGTAAASAAAIAEVARAASAKVGVHLPLPRALIGAAGGGREPETSELAAAVQAAGVAAAVQVIGDGELALLAAFGDRPGILLAAGTGSIGYARDRKGALHRAGGYGWQMGDEGGGYWLGRRALQAVGKAQDGRSDPSTLLARVLSTLGLPTFDEVVRWAAVATPAQVATLAPALLHAAADGDRAAIAAVRDAAVELVELAASLMRHFAEGERIGIACAGGLLRDIALAEAVRKELERRLPTTRLSTASIDPAGVAAVRAARFES